jgi:hypothetical protein
MIHPYFVASGDERLSLGLTFATCSCCSASVPPDTIVAEVPMQIRLWLH